MYRGNVSFLILSTEELMFFLLIEKDSLVLSGHFNNFPLGDSIFLLGWLQKM
jgi:hypothetical protein